MLQCVNFDYCSTLISRDCLNNKHEYFVHLNNRQDQKRPIKKLVQPTVVSPVVAEEERKVQGGMDSDNPVATAAAIAAAAASAATGPFLQVKSHSS